jgi:hypothetical protein
MLENSECAIVLRHGGVDRHNQEISAAITLPIPKHLAYSP